MAWAEILGHDVQVERFRTAVERGRLASTFLLVGPSGIGKRRFATEMAKALLCEATGENELDACGTCEGCRLVNAGSHPDFVTVGKPEDRAAVPVELLIGDRDHRNRQGLCHDISLSPFRGGRKVAIIDDADYLQVEGANCLLKTLEEPPPRSVLFLLATSLARQLPTIRSRCQIVHFRPLEAVQIQSILDGLPDFDPTCPTSQLADLANGSVERALYWSEPAHLEFRTGLLGVLSKHQWPSHLLAKQVADFVDQAGKDGAAKRDRFRLVVSCVAQFYHGLMRSLSGNPAHHDDALTRSIEQASANWGSGIEGAARCIDRCLDAEKEVSSNANMSLLIECWVDEVSGHAKGRKGIGIHAY
jgi:DNA polymerase-3 subunit delta'